MDIDAGSATPNDPQYPQQWNMGNIQMPTAWKSNQFGSKDVLTCAIDTGVDFTHPDLVPNLWMNEKEMNGPGANAANGYQNGIDDDGNGEVQKIPKGRVSAQSTMQSAKFLLSLRTHDAKDERR